MIIVVAKYSRTGLGAVKQVRFYGKYQIVTPGNFDRIRGITAQGLLIADAVELSAEEGCCLQGCFSWLYHDEKKLIHPAIYAITAGGAAAIEAHLDKLIAAEKARKKKAAK